MSTAATLPAPDKDANSSQRTAYARKKDRVYRPTRPRRTADGRPINQSMVSRHGYGWIDVRATYAHLPCQFFWTWLTGKALPTGEPRNPRETLLTPARLAGQICWAWGVILTSIFVATRLDNIFVSIVAIVLVMNRTRGLLHTFHYTSHGASLANMKLARFMAKYFMSIPIMHTTWGEYLKIHARDHHGYPTICTDEDPDQIFVIEHGFKPRMTAREFWFAYFIEPFKPKHIWANIAFRLKQNFVIPPWSEKAPRFLFWIALFSAVTYFGVWAEFALYFLFPLFILTQFSSYIQHVPEHLWFPPPRGDKTVHEWVASLTWGRFLGRPFPDRRDSPNFLVHFGRLAVWWTKIFAVDLPFRLFTFMQDLSSHDFHHRVPKVNFWSITRERANAELNPGSWGPMTETWSVMESMLVMRDHLVYGMSDPFYFPAIDDELLESRTPGISTEPLGQPTAA